MYHTMAYSMRTPRGDGIIADGHAWGPSHYGADLGLQGRSLLLCWQRGRPLSRSTLESTRGVTSPNARGSFLMTHTEGAAHAVHTVHQQTPCLCSLPPLALYFMPTQLSFTLCCLFQPELFAPHAHWEAYGRGSLPLHNLVSDSANPHYVSDPVPRHCGIIVVLDSSEP
jgi:hypothetical protein